MATIQVEKILHAAATEIIKSMIQTQHTTRTRHVRAAAPKKRRLSAAGRAAIRRGVKARWARFHAQQKRKGAK